MHVEPRHSIAELERHARAEKTARVAVRIRAVIMAMRGRDAPTIAEDMGRSRRAVQEWVRWYNQEGLDALRDAPRPGQPRKLTPAQETALCAWLDAGPDQEARECCRRGPEIRRHVEATFGVKYSVPGAYSMLHRLGYSALVPRPVHRKTDAAAQEEFRKSAPLFWSACAANGRGGSSRSGGRTRRGSASRGR